MSRSSFLLVGCLVTGGIVSLLSSPTYAESTSFTQTILPLSCVLTTVNAGPTQTYEVTPKDCQAVVQTPAGVTIPAAPHIASSYSEVVPDPNLPTAPVISQSKQPPIFLWTPLVSSQTSSSTKTQGDTPATKTNTFVTVATLGVLVLGVCIVLLV